LPVDTNIVIAQLAHERTPDEFLSHIAQTGIWAYPFGPDRVRFVTHRDISDDHLNRAVAAIASWS
jgi:threonine aldolase